MDKLLGFFLPAGLFGLRILSRIIDLFSVRISFIRLLTILSLFAISCGLLNSIGDEPYTTEVITIGIIVFLLSVMVPLFKLAKIGFTFLFAFIKKGNN